MPASVGDSLGDSDGPGPSDADGLSDGSVPDGGSDDSPSPDDPHPARRRAPAASIASAGAAGPDPWRAARVDRMAEFERILRG
jgi:hypothetical protein